MSAMLVINPIGGLANRMRALAAGISLAEKLGVEFRVVWYENWELNARFDELFQMPKLLADKIEYPTPLQYGLEYMSPRKRNGYLSVLPRRRFGSIIDDSIRDEDVIFDKCRESVDRHRDVLLQSGTNIFDYSDDLYRSLFRPTDEIERRVKTVLSELGDMAYGVHIRRTDNSESIRCSPDVLFERAIEATIEREPAAKFYLATDSQVTKKRFSEKFGGKIIYNTAPADRGSVSGMQDAMVELFILSRMRAIFGSYYSSFSEAAAKLGAAKLIELKK